MTAPQNLRATGDRIEQSLDELRATAEPRAYQRAEELLRLITDLYGAGLARILEIVGTDQGASRAALIDALADDELVGSLLLVHELHPRSLTQRVEEALASVRPLLERHAGGVGLVDIDPDAAAVRIRLLGSCDGCPSSAITLRSAVERAILDAAPEIVTIDVDEPAHETPIQIGRKPVYDECPSQMAAP